MKSNDFANFVFQIKNDLTYRYITDHYYSIYSDVNTCISFWRIFMIYYYVNVNFFFITIFLTSMMKYNANEFYE